MIHVLLTFVLGVMLFSDPAFAQSKPPGFYIGGNVGHSTFFDVDADGDDLEFDPLGFFISGNFGYHFKPRTRLEAELLFESAGIDNSGDQIEVLRGTLSGYYDFRDSTLFGVSDLRPYVGGGLGFAKIEIGDIENNEFTWHAETGLAIPINDQNLDFVPGIRFEYTFLDDDDGFNDDLWIIQIRAGIRYYF